MKAYDLRNPLDREEVNALQCLSILSIGNPGQESELTGMERALFLIRNSKLRESRMQIGDLSATLTNVSSFSAFCFQDLFVLDECFISDLVSDDQMFKRFLFGILALCGEETQLTAYWKSSPDFDAELAVPED